MKAFTWSFVTSSGLLSAVRKLLFTDQIIKNSWGVHWSKDSVEHLFQNMRPSLWNAQPSFWNTRPSFWGFRRKLKAQLRVCVITRPMLSQSAMVRLGPKHVLIYISWTLSGIFLVNINICNDFYRMKKINVKIQVRRA